MRKPFLTAALSLTLLSSGFAGEILVKDNFQDLADGSTLTALTNWKFYEGWVKPEDGKVIAESGNKFLRLKGDIFWKTQVSLTDKLTVRFKIRANGSDDEIGGFDLRSGDGKQRYDLLCGFKRGGISLNRDTAGQRDNLAKKDDILNSGFQSVEMVVERVSGTVKFTVTVNGSKVIEQEDPQEFSFLKESFNVGFFTFNQKTVDIDDIELTQGK